MAGEEAAAQGAEQGSTEAQQEQQAQPAGETGAEAQGAEGQEQAPEAADETDWKARARQWESRAKANKAKADELAAQLARTEAVSRIAAEKGIDANLLARMTGDTDEEIGANADALAEFARSGSYPEVPDSGAGRPPAVTKEQIMAEKNPVKRASLMAANKHLFI